MTSKLAFEAVDNLLRDICNNKEPFGGKIVIISGDFHQTLTIVRYGTRRHIVENCVKNSSLWNKFKHFKLHKNIRAENNDENFENWLLDVGKGKYSTKFECENQVVEIPK